jgi:hypothetical protein
LPCPVTEATGAGCGGKCCAPAAPTASANIIDRTDIRIIIPPPGIRPVESRQLITQFFAAAESQEARQHSHK